MFEIDFVACPCELRSIGITITKPISTNLKENEVPQPVPFHWSFTNKGDEAEDDCESYGKVEDKIDRRPEEVRDSAEVK